MLTQEAALTELVEVITTRLTRQNNKLLIFGNGGSAADSQHLAAEFVNKFKIERNPLAAIALTTDTSILTAIANDSSFDDVFRRQIQALGQSGDIALGLTTSGKSPNVLLGLKTAKSLGLTTVALSGEGFDFPVDYAFIVPSRNTPRIQEIHITLGHILCELIEIRM